METKDNYVATTKIYSIEDLVTFNVSTGVLHSIKDNSSFTLLAASSECFISLLENHGHLVSKKTLIEQGWERYGLHVSDNTFYQNILMLRKGLRTCGIDKEIIKTIPRKGLLISADVKITPFLIESQEFMERQEESKDSVQQSQNELHKEKRHKPTYSHSLFFIKRPLITLITLAFFFSSVFLFTYSFNYSSNESSILSKYRYIDTLNNCKIYSRVNKNSDEDLIKLSTIKSMHCNSNDYLYISTYKYISRLSVIKCNFKKDKKLTNENCTSFYYLEKK